MRGEDGFLCQDLHREAAGVPRVGGKGGYHAASRNKQIKIWSETRARVCVWGGGGGLNQKTSLAVIEGRGLGATAHRFFCFF